MAVARPRAARRRPATPAAAPARSASARDFSSFSRPVPVAVATARSSRIRAIPVSDKGECAGHASSSVKVPAGVDTGDRIRLSGEGEAGRNGGPPGDLYVEVNVREHAIFEREGEHLSCEVPVSFATAALGGTVEVPTLDGDVTLKVPAETQSGRVFRLRDKGVKPVRGGAARRSVLPRGRRNAGAPVRRAERSDPQARRHAQTEFEPPRAARAGILRGREALLLDWRQVSGGSRRHHRRQLAGWGSRSCAPPSESREISIAAAVASPQSAALAKDAGELAGVGRLGVPVTSDLAAALAQADVAIDFSNARGHPDQPRSVPRRPASRCSSERPAYPADTDFDAAAKDIPLLVAPNTSLGVTLLIELVRQAAAALPAAIRYRDHRSPSPDEEGRALRNGPGLGQGRGGGP